jgi:guanylate kinase
MISFPIILSAPSGAGKTSIADGMLRARQDVGYSVSATTRPRRAHETDGTDYFFLTPDEFLRRRLAGDFAESAEVHGRWYGTLRSEVQRVLGSGRHVLMDIDVQGAREFHRSFPESVRIFVLPPSLEVLISRLRGRNTESDESIEVRLRTAMTEIEAVGDYDYVVINEVLDVATAKVCAIVDAEMTRVSRLGGEDGKVARLLSELRRGMSANV